MNFCKIGRKPIFEGLGFRCRREGRRKPNEQHPQTPPYSTRSQPPAPNTPFRTLTFVFSIPAQNQEIQWHGDHASCLFETPAITKHIITTFNNSIVRGHPIRAITLADINAYAEDLTLRVAVGNLDPRIEPRGLVRVLGLYGRVVDVKIRYPTQEGENCALAYVVFEKEASVMQAVSELNKIVVGEFPLCVKVFDLSDPDCVFLNTPVIPER